MSEAMKYLLTASRFQPPSPANRRMPSQPKGPPPPARRFSSVAGWVLRAAATLSLVLISGCSKSDQAPARRAVIVPVRAALAVQKNIPVEIQAIGVGEATATVALKSQINGQIMRVHFIEGQDLKKNDPLFTIDARAFEASLKQAEATLARDIALAENAQQEASRAEDLRQTDSVPQRQYDLAKASEAATKALVNADRAAVDNAKLQLEYCSLRSPIDGRAGDLLMHEGNIIKANDATMVIINQVVPLYVTFSVPEKHLPDIKRALAAGELPVRAVVPGREDAPAQGKLAFVDNTVDATTGTIRLKGTFANAEQRLWPGQFVNVTMTLSVQTNAVLVPSQAVESGQRGQYVFVVKPDSTVAYRAVTIGRLVGEELVIDQGLQPGERVVTDGQLQLVDGAKVDVKSDSEKPADKRP
jgi:membrane fusion protein, multidrug efflux system